MKIDSIKIKNFRGYKDETKIELNDLTVFVGKNDIGKSTILEALDIFFNDGKGVIKLDKTDVNVRGKKEEDLDIEISVCFSELPEKIITKRQRKRYKPRKCLYFLGFLYVS